MALTTRSIKVREGKVDHGSQHSPKCRSRSVLGERRIDYNPEESVNTLVGGTLGSQSAPRPWRRKRRGSYRGLEMQCRNR